MTRLIILSTLILTSATAPLFAPTEPVHHYRVDDPRFIAPEEFRATVIHYAAEFGVPLDVAIRLPFEESRWDETAMHRNRDGSYDHGPMQLNSRYHYVMVTRANIRDGLKYWAYCWRKTGKIYDATLAYICGLRGMAKPTLSAKREAWAVVKGDV